MGTYISMGTHTTFDENLGNLGKKGDKKRIRSGNKEKVYSLFPVSVPRKWKI